jgi:aldose sugar dehydrogenase
MNRTALLVLVGGVLLASAGTHAQSVRAIPRPPLPMPGAPPEGSLAPDGYQPLPQWLGQTRAPKPVKTAAYDVQVVAQGLNASFTFNFLPDGRMILGQRSGHIQIVGKDGAVSDVEGLPQNLFARGQQGIYEARPDRAFTTNRLLYFTYTALPDGANMAALPRAPGITLVARC